MGSRLNFWLRMFCITLGWLIGICLPWSGARRVPVVGKVAMQLCMFGVWAE
jgi:hypothetical protein